VCTLEIWHGLNVNMKNKRCVFKVCSLTFIPILPTPPPIQKSNASSKVWSQIKISKFMICFCFDFEDVKEIPEIFKTKIWWWLHSMEEVVSWTTDATRWRYFYRWCCYWRSCWCCGLGWWVGGEPGVLGHRVQQDVHDDVEVFDFLIVIVIDNVIGEIVDAVA
jgi:hypothetical protein